MINSNLKKKLKDTFKDQLCFDAKLSEYNTWKVGGRADILFEPKTINDLSIFLKNTTTINKTIVGNGSNILIRDGGIRGCVITFRNTLKDYIIIDEGEFYFEAGLACMKIANIVSKSKFGGLEFLSGIPGSLGGALAMNAGCYGKEIWEHIDKITTINYSGDIKEHDKSRYEYDYRKVDSRDDEFFIGAKFIKLNSNINSEKIIKEYLKNRRETQPTGKLSCGSVFKNPEGHYAGQLIENLGLKGFSIGDAEISRKHANFIINNSKATAEDIESLILYIQDIVFKKLNIKLETEVKFLGDKIYE